MRVDKWLWTVRLFKTRSIATEECRKGKVECEGRALKPSHEVHVGDVLIVFKDQLRREVRVMDLPASRLGAKLVPEFMEDLTPQDVLDQYKERRSRSFEHRPRGIGRPTKRHRRDIDRLKGPN